mmetsp:Transcript_36850/g.66795  ORF Transcript_36850/g.66795 Transcript_36850/m.66795 type:complete len:112 (-) Transcript_36850:302-637(-)
MSPSIDPKPLPRQRKAMQRVLEYPFRCGGTIFVIMDMTSGLATVATINSKLAPRLKTATSPATPKLKSKSKKLKMIPTGAVIMRPFLSSINELSRPANRQVGIKTADIAAM